MSFGGLLLVYGALHGPLPRTPMYGTPHQHSSLWTGVGLNLLGAGICVAWALSGQRPVLHLCALPLHCAAAYLAWRYRARAFLLK